MEQHQKLEQAVRHFQSLKKKHQDEPARRRGREPVSNPGIIFFCIMLRAAESRRRKVFRTLLLLRG